MAREMYDIALNDELELRFAGGDFMVVESTERHQQLLLMYDVGQIPGEANLLSGVGIGNQYQNDAGERELARLIQREFTADGMVFNTLRVRNVATMDVKINAYYR